MSSFAPFTTPINVVASAEVYNDDGKLYLKSNA